MEIFDVVNRNDEVVGTATRDQCHSNPKLIHRSVHFTLFDPLNKKILITQRSFTKSTDPGKICFAGEHLLTKENYYQAAIRGTKEEFSFIPTKSFEFNHHLFRSDQQSEFVRLFIILWESQPIKWDRYDFATIKWLSFTNLKNINLDFSTMTQFWIDNTNWNQLSAIIAHG